MDAKYPLVERTTVFSEKIIEFIQTLKITPVNSPIVNQLIRSATSIGANYMEANNASSRKDFQNKIFICKKEAQETKYWLRLLLKTDEGLSEKVNVMLDEVQQLIMIFQKIISTMKNPK